MNLCNNLSDVLLDVLSDIVGSVSDLCRIFGYCQLNVCLIYFKFILLYSFYFKYDGKGRSYSSTVRTRYRSN